MPETAALLHQLSPSGDARVIEGLAAGLDKWCDSYQVNTHKRFAYLIANIAEETDNLTTLVERGSVNYFRRYDPDTHVGKVLGNTEPGDGYRYRGRGALQITGRDNYRRYGKLIGVDLIADPDAAANPENSVKIALTYWKDFNLNAAADRDDMLTIVHKINGGTNGLAMRQAYFKRASRLWPVELARQPTSAVEGIADVPAPASQAPIATDAATTGGDRLGTVGAVAGTVAIPAGGLLEYIHSPYALMAFGILAAVVIALGVAWIKRH